MAAEYFGLCSASQLRELLEEESGEEANARSSSLSAQERKELMDVRVLITAYSYEYNCPTRTHWTAGVLSEIHSRLSSLLAR